MFTFQKILPLCKEHKYFVISLLVVFIISAVSTHGDFTLLTQAADKITLGNFDLYNFFWTGKSSPMIFPPLIFFIDALNLLLFKIAHIVNFSFSTITDPSQWHQWQIFVLKLRYILIFILSYFLVIKTAKAYTANDSDVKIIANLWITSPVLLLLTFAQGNNDIYPVFFSFCFLYFVFKKQNIGALVCLGLVAALKNYALLLTPFVAIILAEKNYTKAFSYGLLVAVIYLIPSLFYLNHLGFFLLGGGIGREGTFVLQTIIPSVQPYYIFIILYFSALLYLIFSDNEVEIKSKKNDLIVAWCFLILSFCFMLSFFFPQWYLWLIPFSIFIFYKNTKLFYFSLLIYCVFFGITALYFQNNLDLNLFTPISPVWVSQQLTKLATSHYHIQSKSGLFYSVFAALLIMFNYFQFKKINNSEKTLEGKLDHQIVKYNYLVLLVYFFLIIFVPICSHL